MYIIMSAIERREDPSSTKRIIDSIIKKSKRKILSDHISISEDRDIEVLKTRFISYLSHKSIELDYDFIDNMLSHYGCLGIRDLTLKQVADFIVLKGLSLEEGYKDIPFIELYNKEQ